MNTTLEIKDKVILAVSAHPDDMDVLCGGTISKFSKEGAKIYYLVLTDGSKGHEDHTIPTFELISTRKTEEKNAADILGVEEVYFLNFCDGELENNLDLRKQIVKVIREIKPDIVITMDPTFCYDLEKGRINHPDHRVAGQATIEAVYPFARNSRTFPELISDGYTPHIVKEILLTQTQNPNLYIDVTETFESKLSAIKAHCSQFRNPEVVCESMTQRAESTGKNSGLRGAKYAESFARITLKF
jgi:LmbE family N-acetylglucosaminyl deacetylase